MLTLTQYDLSRKSPCFPSLVSPANPVEEDRMVPCEAGAGVYARRSRSPTLARHHQRRSYGTLPDQQGREMRAVHVWHRRPECQAIPREAEPSRIGGAEHIGPYVPLDMVGDRPCSVIHSIRAKVRNIAFEGGF